MSAGSLATLAEVPLKTQTKSSSLSIVSVAAVQARILVIREHQVMLDQDLAELYGVETGALTRAVRRNEERFPSDFMFQLTKDEYADLRSQIGISSGHGGRRYSPYVFTAGNLGEHERHLAAIFKALRQLATPVPKRKHPLGFSPPENGKK